MRIIEFVKKNRSRFISFDEAAAMRNPVPGIAEAMRFLYVVSRCA